MCVFRGRLRFEFYWGAAVTTPRRAARGGEERGEKFPLACCVAAGLVNPQECRIRRDPLSTDRSSTKPCGKSRSGTRTCLQLAPVLTDPYGKQLLQTTLLSRAHSAVAQHPNGFPPPTEARRSSLLMGCLVICKRCQWQKGKTLLLLSVYIFIV